MTKLPSLSFRSMDVQGSFKQCLVIEKKIRIELFFHFILHILNLFVSNYILLARNILLLITSLEIGPCKEVEYKKNIMK